MADSEGHIIQTVRDLEESEAVVRNLGQLSNESRDISSRVKVLEDIGSTKNTEQSSIAIIGYTASTVSATYVQAEIVQITSDVKILANKVDALIASLQSADILK